MSEYVKFDRCHHMHNKRLQQEVGNVGELIKHSLERGESLVKFPRCYPQFWIKDRYLTRITKPEAQHDDE